MCVWIERCSKGLVLHSQDIFAQFSIDEARVRVDYLDVFGMELKYGQFFSKDGEQDQVVINEAAAQKMGVENPVGEHAEREEGKVEEWVETEVGGDAVREEGKVAEWVETEVGGDAVREEGRVEDKEDTCLRKGREER